MTASNQSWNPSNPNLHSDFHRFMVHGPCNSHLCVSSGNQIHLGWGGRWAPLSLWCIRITASGKLERVGSAYFEKFTGRNPKQTRKFESSKEDVHRYAQNLSYKNFHRICTFDKLTSKPQSILTNRQYIHNPPPNLPSFCCQH